MLDQTVRKTSPVKSAREIEVPTKYAEQVDISGKSRAEPVVLQKKEADYFIERLNESSTLDEDLRILLNKKPSNLTDFF